MSATTTTPTLYHVMVTNPSYVSASGPLRISLTTLLLTTILITSLYTAIITPHAAVRQFTLYSATLSAFHMLEFYCTALFHSEANVRSFLLDHSKQYKLAVAAAVIEYIVESALCYALNVHIKHNAYIMFVGLVLTLAGQYVRSAAMLTCGPNFTHIIREDKRQTHTLITHGLYSIVRHPSYTGWFVLSVAQQVMLVNPVCIVLFTYLNHRFFSARIEYEEIKLFQFFGDAYQDYWKTVKYSGVPYVNTVNHLAESDDDVVLADTEIVDRSDDDTHQHKH